MTLEPISTKAQLGEQPIEVDPQPTEPRDISAILQVVLDNQAFIKEQLAWIVEVLKLHCENDVGEKEILDLLRIKMGRVT